MSIVRGPYRWYAWVILATVLVTAVPYVFGVIVTPGDAVFAGSHVLTPGDFSVYFSYLEQIRQGTGLVRDLYSTELAAWPFFSPVWAVSGMIGTVLHLAPAYTLHLVRLLLIAPLLTIIAVLIHDVIQSPRARRWAFLLAVFGSGAGFFAAPFIGALTMPRAGYYHWPMDLWVPEATTFLTIYHNPLFIVALIGLITAFTFLLRALRTRERSATLFAGAGSFVAILVHPFHAFTLALTIALFWGFRAVVRHPLQRQEYRIVALVGLIAFPAVLFHAAVLAFDPGAAGRAAQNVNLTTVWWLTAVSYGLLGLGAVVGSVMTLARHRGSPARILLVSWFLAHAVLTSLPQIIYQRRLTEGWHIPMALLTVIGLRAFWGSVRAHLPRRLKSIGENATTLILGFILCFTLSNVYVVALDLERYTRATPEQVPFFHYTTRSFIDAYAWVRSQTPTDAIFLAGTQSGLVLPGGTGRSVYVGHGVETLDFGRKAAEVDFLFDGTATETDWRRFIRRERIAYVWWGPWENARYAFDPATAPFLREVYADRDIHLYATAE